MSKTKEELMKDVNMKKHKEEQEKHRLQLAQNRKDYLETTMRKQRTHRLISRGAAMESIIPEIKDMSDFSDDNAKKIDAMCLYLQEKLEFGEISQEELYFYKASLIDAVTKVSNTSGTYGSFLKINDNRKYKKIILEPLTITNNDKKMSVIVRI